MQHRDYVAAREARDTEYRRAREALRPEYEFRRQLIAARIRTGLSQQELARRAGLHRSVIARLETGESNPTVETLSKLANALNVSIEVVPFTGIVVHDRGEPALAE